MKGFALALICAALSIPTNSWSKARSLKHRPAPQRVIAPAPQPIALLHPPRTSTQPVVFINPPVGFNISASNLYLVGNVADARARLTINGSSVAVHKDGGFLAWLPVSLGTFTFRAELALSTNGPAAVSTHQIIISSPPAPLPDAPLAIDTTSLWPKGDLQLRPGDWWTARMKASRGQSARMRVGHGPWHLMREVNSRLGLYEATLQTTPEEHYSADNVEYQIGTGWSAPSVKGKARLWNSIQTYGVATVKTTPAGFGNLKTAPNGGNWMFPLPGSRFAISGREGDAVRVDLAPSGSAWIDSREVTLSTISAPPLAETGYIGVTEYTSGASVRIGLSERVAFDVYENDAQDALIVRFYSAYGHSNLVTFDGGSDFIDQVRWRQESAGVVAFTIRLKPGRRLWGWNARFDAGSILRLWLRRPPTINPKKPLEGIKVMLDPGHMPSAPSAAIGPLGTIEMDANFAIAQSAAEKLRLAGAIVLLTRATTTDEVSLVDRPLQAVNRGADLFVSLHNNDLPFDSNPFARPRGFTVFYYHPHSLALGRAVHDAYARAIPLPDQGLQWDNLLVTRLTAMPSILIENATMIFPEQEAALNDPAFRGKLGDALVAGLKAFLLEVGQKKPK